MKAETFVVMWMTKFWVWFVNVPWSLSPELGQLLNEFKMLSSWLLFAEDFVGHVSVPLMLLPNWVFDLTYGSLIALICSSTSDLKAQSRI